MNVLVLLDHYNLFWTRWKRSYDSGQLLARRRAATFIIRRLDTLWLTTTISGYCSKVISSRKLIEPCKTADSSLCTVLFEDDLHLKYSIVFVRFLKGAPSVTVPTHERFLFTKHVLCAGIVVKVDFLLGKRRYLARNTWTLICGFRTPSDKGIVIDLTMWAWLRAL